MSLLECPRNVPSSHSPVEPLSLHFAPLVTAALLATQVTEATWAVAAPWGFSDTPSLCVLPRNDLQARGCH